MIHRTLIYGPRLARITAFSRKLCIRVAFRFAENHNVHANGQAFQEVPVVTSCPVLCVGSPGTQHLRQMSWISFTDIGRRCWTGWSHEKASLGCAAFAAAHDAGSVRLDRHRDRFRVSCLLRGSVDEHVPCSAVDINAKFDLDIKIASVSIGLGGTLPLDLLLEGGKRTPNSRC
jgi:hypothetical protein